MPLPVRENITGPYGDNVHAAQPQVPDGGTLSDGFQMVTETRRVPINDDVLSDHGVQPYHEARENRKWEQVRPKYSALESAFGAASGWMGLRILQKLDRPEFAYDEPINTFEFLQGVDIALNSAEREFFDEVAKGRQSAEYALKVIKDSRLAGEMMGDNPITAAMVGFVDPIAWAIPAGVAVRGLTGMTARAARAATSGAFGYASSHLQEGAVYSGDTLLNVILSSAAGAAMPVKASARPVRLGTVDEVASTSPSPASVQVSAPEPVSPQAPEIPRLGYEQPADVPRLPAPEAPELEFLGSGPREPLWKPEPWVTHRLPAPEKPEDIRLPGPEPVPLLGFDQKSKWQTEIRRIEDILRGLKEGTHEVPGGISKNKYKKRLKEKLEHAKEQEKWFTQDGETASTEWWKPKPEPEPPRPKTIHEEFIENLKRSAEDPGFAKERTATWYEQEMARRAWAGRKPPGSTSFELVDPYSPDARAQWETKFRDNLAKEAKQQAKAHNDFSLDGKDVEDAVYVPEYVNKDILRETTEAAVGTEGRPVMRQKKRKAKDASKGSGQSKSQGSAEGSKGSSKSAGSGVSGESKSAGSSRKAETQAQGSPEKGPEDSGSADLEPETPLHPPIPPQHKAYTAAGKAAESAAWNMHKQMYSYSGVGRYVADLLYDDVLRPGKVSVESTRAAVLGDFNRAQMDYERLLRDAMKEDGYGILKQVLKTDEAFKHQRSIEKQVMAELLRREAESAYGPFNPNPAGLSPRIKAMADKLDELHQMAVDELKRSNVQGAEHLQKRAGYLKRRWDSAQIESKIAQLEAAGMRRADAIKALSDLVGDSVLAKSPLIPEEYAKKIGSAIIDRALRKGYFEDAVNHVDGSDIKAIADELRRMGLPHNDVDKIIDAVSGTRDIPSRPGYLKGRVGLDHTVSMTMPDGTKLSVMDLMDNNVSTLLDQYLKGIATDAAMARHGLDMPSKIIDLRQKLAESVPVKDRANAIRLFDDTMAYFKGLPSGAAMNDAFRVYQGFGRTITLAMSGLWQTTEFATAAAEYGMWTMLKTATKKVPGLRRLFKPTAEEGADILDVLSQHSKRSTRMRPFLTRFSDGFEMDSMTAAHLKMGKLGDMVPYANAMRYIQSFQADIVADMLLNRLKKAVNGDAAAIEAMGRYGLDDAILNKLRPEIQRWGYNVDAWADEAWDAVRPVLYRAQDTGVLHSRLGDVPHFAQFDAVGKTLFTYRTFILAAHNKILSGRLAHDGASGLGLLLLYQLPLSMLAVQAQAVMSGQTLESDELIQKSIAQMGALGLFTEPFKWITGQSNSVGAPVLIPMDRGIRAVQAAGAGDGGDFTSAAINLMPIISANPVINSFAKHLRED